MMKNKHSDKCIIVYNRIIYYALLSFVESDCDENGLWNDLDFDFIESHNKYKFAVAWNGFSHLININGFVDLFSQLFNPFVICCQNMKWSYGYFLYFIYFWKFSLLEISMWNCFSLLKKDFWIWLDRVPPNMFRHDSLS